MSVQRTLIRKGKSKYSFTVDWVLLYPFVEHQVQSSHFYLSYIHRSRKAVQLCKICIADCSQNLHALAAANHSLSNLSLSQNRLGYHTMRWWQLCPVRSMLLHETIELEVENQSRGNNINLMMADAWEQMMHDIHLWVFNFLFCWYNYKAILVCRNLTGMRVL